MLPILKVEIRSAVNYLKNIRTPTVISLVIIAMMALFFLPMIVLAFFNLLLTASVDVLPSVMLMISVLLIVILSLITVNRIVKDMFMNKNMQLYLTFPVTAVDLLRAKFIMQLCTRILPVTLPVGFIAGIAFMVRDMNPLSFVATIAYFILLSILTLAISYIIVFLVTKVASPKKVSEILTFIGGFAAVLPYLIITFGVVNMGTVLSFMPHTGWLYEGFIYDVTMGKSIVFTVFSAIIAIVIFASLTRIVQSGFVKGWMTASASGRKSGSQSLGVHSVKRALVMKDINMTIRDFKEWAAILPQYLIPFALYYVAFNPVGPQAVRPDMDIVVITVSITGTIIISMFVSSSNTARDARHHDMMRALPVEAGEVVISKFIYNFITIVPLYMLFSLLVFIFADVSVAALLYSLVFIVLSASAVIPIGMFFGVKYPVVNRNRPSDRLDTGAAIIMTIAIFVLIFSTGLMSNVFTSAEGDINHRMAVIMMVAMFLISVLIYFIFTKIVQRIYDRGLKIVYKG